MRRRRAPRSPPSSPTPATPATSRWPRASRGSWTPRPARSTPSSTPPAAPPVPTRSTTSTTSGGRCATSSPPTTRRPPAHERGLAHLHPAHRGAGRALGPELPPGGLRGGPGQLHDGDRRLRTAGAHAALVLRRALHLPADPAPHGALAPVRGGLPRQPRARLPRREQRARRE